MNDQPRFGKGLSKHPRGVILSGALLIGVLRGFAWGNVTLSHVSTSVPQGISSVQVPLQIRTDPPAASTALQVETTLPPALAGRLTISTGPAAETAEKVLVSSTTPSRVRYAIYGLNRTEIGNGNIAVLTFALTGVPAGTYPLRLEDWAVASSSEGVSVTRALESGAITITAEEESLQRPSNFQAEGRSSTTIHLSWTNPFNPRAERILIQRSGQREGGFATINTITLSPDYPEGFQSAFDDSSRSPNSQWFYQLVAERGEQRAATDPVSARTHAAPPTRPPDGAFSGVGERRLTVAWGAGGNPPATRYVIELATTSRFNPLVERDTVRATSRVFSNLTPNTEYFSQAKALNDEDRETSYTSLGSTVTPAAWPTDPAIPEVSNTQLLARWNPNGNPLDTQFIAELALTRDFSTLVSSDITVSTSSLFSSLTPDTDYHFRVKARDRVGRDSAYSDIVSTRTTRGLQPPAAPAGFRAEGISSTTIRLNWTNPVAPPAQAIYVERSATGEVSTFVRIATVTLSSNGYPPSSWYDDSTLSPNSQWFYQLKAANAVGESRASSTQSAVTLANIPLPLAYTGVAERQLTANWDANGNPRLETRFVIELAAQESFSPLTASATVTTTSYTFTGLTPGTAYWGRVKASNRADPPRDTGYAPLGSTTTAGSLPPAGVTNVQAVAPTRQRVRLTWTHDGQRLSGFRIFRSMDPPRIPYEQLTELRDVAQRAYIDTRVPPGRLGTIRYQLLAFGPGGESPRTETGVVPDSTPLGLTLNDLPELTNQTSVSVALLVTAPSPSQDEREVLVTIERRTSQGQDQLVRDVIPVGETQRRSVSLRDGSNELIFSLRDIVNEEPMQSPTRRPVVVDHEPPRFVETPDPTGSRRHRDVRHGFPRQVAHPVGAVNKDGVRIEANGVVLTRLVDQMGNPVNQPMAVLPVIQGRNILLRHPQQPQQSLELPGNSDYQLEFVKEKIRDAAGNTLTGPVPTIRFRTTLLPGELNQVVVRDRPTPVRLMIPGGTLRTESYLLVNQSEAFVDTGVTERIRQAHDHLSRVANQFRLALPNKETEVTLFSAQDGIPITGQSTAGLTLTIPYGTGGYLPRALEASSGVGVDRRTLQMAWLNPATKQWEPVRGSQVNPAEQTVSASIVQAGVYTVIGARSPAVSAIFAFPVPFQPGLNPNHRTITFANTPKDTVIKVFTVAGDLVRELTAGDDTGQVTWDVTNSAGERVASDVYLYVAEHGGDRKTGKLVIIR